MREKPPLSDEKIIACLQHSHQLAVASLEFLPLGYDLNAGVYRVCVQDGKTYFLKVKKGIVYEPGLFIPHYLKENGIQQVIAPLPTITQTLWQPIEDFVLILYPFIEGDSGSKTGLSDHQWMELGETVKRIHTTQLPPALASQMKTETFPAQWREFVTTLQEQVVNGVYEDPFQREMALLWRERQVEIGRIVNRAEALAQMLRPQSLEFVLCHADLHAANMLITPDNEMFMVDWDETVLAPKERDLMFVMESAVITVVAERETELFFRGYGATDINWLALAYYRYEWAVQDISGFGELVFLRPEAGAETKAEAIRYFRFTFEPGNIVDIASRTEKYL